MMKTQVDYDRLLRMRWCHYYQWKNLLDKEQEARRQLEQHHQEQLQQLPDAQKWTKAGHLLHEQLVSLRVLRQAQQQERMELKAVQAQQMHLIEEQLTQQGKVNRFVCFEHLSALRQL